MLIFMLFFNDNYVVIDVNPHIQRLWDKEVRQAAKDFRSPKLGKVLIQCYWRAYVVFGVYTFIEVRAITLIRLYQMIISGTQHYYYGHLPDICPRLSHSLFSEIGGDQSDSACATG